MDENGITVGCAINTIRDSLQLLTQDFEALTRRFHTLRNEMQDHARECDNFRKLHASDWEAGMRPERSSQSREDGIPSQSKDSFADQQANDEVPESSTALNVIRDTHEPFGRLDSMHPSEKCLEREMPGAQAHFAGFKDSESEAAREHKPTQEAGVGRGCPFAAMRNAQQPRQPHSNALPTPSRSVSRRSRGRRSHRASHHDPLQPEIQKSRSHSPIDSAASAPACPIRFLDQHTPEDIATYFEQHKHELPRSHEICVKRFQTNADSIRELDAKYGSLVAMIQGLGEKHKPMLPADRLSEEDEAGLDEASNEKIQAWNQNVSEIIDQNEDTQGAEDPKLESQSAGSDKDRVGHFLRELREIRVGESPSRPWGLPLPAKYLDRDDPPVAKDGHTTHSESEAAHASAEHALLKPEIKARGKCPVSHVQARSHEVCDRSSTKLDGNECPHATLPDVMASENQKPQLDRPPNAADRLADLADAGKDEPVSRMHSRVTNNGLMVVAGPDLPRDMHLTNNGTFLVGFPEREAKSLMKNLTKSR